MPDILWMGLIGLVTGALAKLILSGNDPGGLILTMLLGIAGSLAVGFLGRELGWYQAGEGAAFLTSAAGAAVLCAVPRLLQRASPGTAD